MLASLNLVAAAVAEPDCRGARGSGGRKDCRQTASMVARVEPHARAVEALADRLQGARDRPGQPWGPRYAFPQDCRRNEGLGGCWVLPHTVGYDPAVGRVMGSTDKIAASAAAPVAASPTSGRIAAALNGIGVANGGAGPPGRSAHELS